MKLIFIICDNFKKEFNSKRKHNKKIEKIKLFFKFNIFMFILTWKIVYPIICC